MLVVSDESDGTPSAPALRDIAPDLVLSCGDLPAEHLEMIVDVCNVPLLYVPGNHDPAPRSMSHSVLDPPFLRTSTDEGPRPHGGTNVDGKMLVARGLRIAGLGGSVRYRPGPNQYSQAEMKRRSLRLELRVRASRARPDILITHAPPRRLGDAEDPAHHGFEAFHRLLRVLRPRYHFHGHVHGYGRALPDRHVGSTTIVNAVGHRLVDLEPRDQRPS